MCKWRYQILSSKKVLSLKEVRKEGGGERERGELKREEKKSMLTETKSINEGKRHHTPRSTSSYCLPNKMIQSHYATVSI